MDAAEPEVELAREQEELTGVDKKSEGLADGQDARDGVSHESEQSEESAEAGASEQVEAVETVKTTTTVKTVTTVERTESEATETVVAESVETAETVESVEIDKEVEVEVVEAVETSERTEAGESVQSVETTETTATETVESATVESVGVEAPGSVESAEVTEAVVTEAVNTETVEKRENTESLETVEKIEKVEKVEVAESTEAVEDVQSSESVETTEIAVVASVETVEAVVEAVETTAADEATEETSIANEESVQEFVDLTTEVATTEAEEAEVATVSEIAAEVVEEAVTVEVDSTLAFTLATEDIVAAIVGDVVAEAVATVDESKLLQLVTSQSNEETFAVTSEMEQNVSSTEEKVVENVVTTSTTTTTTTTTEVKINSIATEESHESSHHAVLTTAVNEGATSDEAVKLTETQAESVVSAESEDTSVVPTTRLSDADAAYAAAEAAEIAASFAENDEATSSPFSDDLTAEVQEPAIDTATESENTAEEQITVDESVVIEAKASHSVEETTEQLSENSEKAEASTDSATIETAADSSSVTLDNASDDGGDAHAASHSVSSDEEGWRSDDTDSIDGGETSGKKKSRRFRAPMRSMISRFANKVSSSIPKKMISHRTESAAKLELMSPVKSALNKLESPKEALLETHRTESVAQLELMSPVKRALHKLESPKEVLLETHRTESVAQLELMLPVSDALDKLDSPKEVEAETHRTDSASKLELEGKSPVKNIVNRFEKPKQESLDSLKFRTVRSFFDEKERSISVSQEKEKYDSVLKTVNEAEVTPKKPSGKTMKLSPKATAAGDSHHTHSSPAPATPVKEVAPNATMDTTSTPLKDIVNRFEKKPEQSLDNLPFRTVRTFFPTAEEPSIRVGAEKEKYEALTEQQKAEAHRLEEERIAKVKAAETKSKIETETETETVAVEEHLHVRDLAQQLERRSSMSRDMAPVSLSRSSSAASDRSATTPVRLSRTSSGAHDHTTPVSLARSTSNSSDRSATSATSRPPSLSRSASVSSDRPPRIVTRSQSDASSHHGDEHTDEFHVKDVAARFEARASSPSPHSAHGTPRRASGVDVTLAAAHSQLRRASEPPAIHTTSAKGSEDAEVFHVKDIASRFEAVSLSRQSSVVEAATVTASETETVVVSSGPGKVSTTTTTTTTTTTMTPPRIRRNSSQSSAVSTPAPETPKVVQIASNAVLETTPSASVKNIAHRFETKSATSIETPAYRTVETFFKEVDEPSIRVRAEKQKLEALEKQKELEAKNAWAKTLVGHKVETLDWFLMPAATNPAFVRLHAVLSERDPVTALAMFPRPEFFGNGNDSDLPVPMIPMDLPPFA